MLSQEELERLGWIRKPIQFSCEGLNWDYKPVDRSISRKKANERSRLKRRALMYANGPCDNITLHELFMRDEGLCGICNVHLEDNETGSIDHIHPLSLGGTHTWSNVQLAHIKCNILKGNKLGFKILSGAHQKTS